jgi:hypothetical protein
MKAIVSTLPPPPQQKQGPQPGAPSAPAPALPAGFKQADVPPPPSYQSRYVWRKKAQISDFHAFSTVNK